MDDHRMMQHVTATINDMDPKEKLQLHFKVRNLNLDADDVEKEIIKANFMKTVKELFMTTHPEDRVALKQKILGLSKGVREGALTLVGMKNKKGGRSRRKSKRRKQTKRR